MLMAPKQGHERTGARAEKLQSSQQMGKGTQDEARTPADEQEVAVGAAVKQTLEIQEASKGTHIRFPNMAKKFSAKPSVVQKLPCKLDLDTQLNSKPRLTLQKVIQVEDRKKTLHLTNAVQQENQSRRTFKKTTFQPTVPDTEGREMERMVNWTRITTAARFRDRDEKEG